MTRKTRRSALWTLGVVLPMLCSSCIDEQHPGTYYTFSGYSIATRLESQSEEFSEFVKILKLSSKNLWGELQTYGKNTCFAPNNSAIEDFLTERSAKDGVTYSSVEDLPIELIDSLAENHLVEGVTCYVGEMPEGAFQKVNRLDRYLLLNFDSTAYETDDNAVKHRLTRCVNKFSRIFISDDTCENGVIHAIDHCIDFTGNYVYDLLSGKYNQNTKLFYEALKATDFLTVLNEYYDNDYHIGNDSIGSNSRVELHASTRSYTLQFWEHRKTCFTIFVETDQVFAENHIYNLVDLKAYAKQIYDEVYPEDAGIEDPTDPRNSLNRFMGYHIIPALMGYSNFNTRTDEIDYFSAMITDPEDYFETLAPNALLRVSTDVTSENPQKRVFINRQGKEGNGSTVFKGDFEPGIEILSPSAMGDVEQIAMNGIIHYIDKILVYDKNVRENILDRRLRIDAGTLSPDFITSGARGAYTGGDNKKSIGFKNPKHYYSYNSSYKIHLRPVEESTNTYEGDAIDIEGMFDIYVKLPPVPHDGTWQLRVSFRALENYCGIAQYYMACVKHGDPVARDSWSPLGLPCDLRVNLDDASVGWISDEDLDDDDAIDALDKSMKNRGWMKGPDSQMTQNRRSHREENHQGRCIISTEYMLSNMDYYLRFKQLLDKEDAQYCFDYIELVPKTVYDNYEDKH